MDLFLIFIARALRMFSYGMIAVIMIKNLVLRELDDKEIGIFQSAVIFGDIIISLILTTKADKIGRKNTLIAGAILKFITGIIYVQSSNFIVLIITGTLGVISVTGTEIGPFLPVEQSVLSQIIQQRSINEQDIPKNTSRIFGYYGMVGYISEALGAAFSGFAYSHLTSNIFLYSELRVTGLFFYLYAFLGLLKAFIYLLIDGSSAIEAKAVKKNFMLNYAGINPKNFKTIVMLSILFAFDAFGGAFVAKSFISYYYSERYGIILSKVGLLLFCCNIVSGISGILSSKLVQKIGAMATMIFTHLPSNLFLLAIPFFDNSNIAMLLLLGRFCISQMDVPARQTYVNLVVSSSQRSAANGITNIARSVGLSIGMGLNGYFISSNITSFSFAVPFLLAGGIKIVYDITLYSCFLLGKQPVNPQQFEFQIQSSKESKSQVFGNQMQSEAAVEQIEVQKEGQASS